MLTQNDLQAIGHLIEEKFAKPLQRDLGVRIDDVRTGLGGKLDSLRTEMDTKFDAVQEQLDGIENRMVRFEHLERWEVGLVELLDQRYVRR